MKPLRFNEDELIRKLERLPVPLRTAFAAACAERLSPSYASFASRVSTGNVVTLHEILEQLWIELEGRRMSAQDVQQQVELCMRLMPHEEVGSDIPEAACAEDAVATLAYALRSHMSGSAQEAAWAGRRAYESLDRHVIAEHGIDINSVEAERSVLSDSLVQAELARQERDLMDLQAAELNVMGVARQIRDRARAASEIVFRRV